MNEARYAFLERIIAKVKTGEEIFIISDDYAAPCFDLFREEYPEYFISAGIAEQNCVSVACGLALAGKKAIVYGCAPFPLTRAVDQLKSAVSLMNCNIVLMNAGIGFGVPEYGATHYNIDDIAITRCIPNLRIVTPSDVPMSLAVADYVASADFPVYLRYDKYSGGSLYLNREIDFSRGFNVVRDGKGLTLITNGNLTNEVFDAISEFDYDIKQIDIYSFPYNEEHLLAEIGDLPILTVEEHLISGGIGTMILELLNKYGKTNTISRMGVEFTQGYPQTSGGRSYYLAQYGISINDILKRVRLMLGI